MRSQILTIMAPEDEQAFLSHVLLAPSVWIIPEVRFPSPDVPRTRDLRAVSGRTCMLWDCEVLAVPEVKRIEPCHDYALQSDESLIQFLRSPVTAEAIGAGRIALATGWKGAAATNPRTAPAMEAWFKRLSRWIKAHFSNSFVYASDYKPDVGSRECTVWGGPEAIRLSKQGVRLKHNGPPEYSLRHFDPSDEQAVLARYRKPQRWIGLGRVEAVGEMVDPALQRQVFRVRLDAGHPLRDFEGSFRRGHPAPAVGGEVACVFSENIFGRHSAPWEADEIRVLGPKRREQTLQSLKRSWRL